VFKIGEFSRLGQVTVKTLRYYDNTGLLKPAHVDRFTGYRYYLTEQLAQLNRILALKDLGLSLEQIAQLMDDSLTAEQMRGMLRLKCVELQERLRDEQARLARVEARLKQIEMEGKMPKYEVIIKKVAAQKVVSIREIAPTVKSIGELFDEVVEAVARDGVKSMGPWIAIYHHEGYREHDLDLEVAVPVDSAFNDVITLAGDRRMTVRELPAAEMMASLLYQGDYGNIGEAYMAIGNLIGAQGYTCGTPCREIYLRAPGDVDDPAQYLTEIQFPAEKA
jgi:DNA-binding transcriptional MerR regulator